MAPASHHSTRQPAISGAPFRFVTTPSKGFRIPVGHSRGRAPAALPNRRPVTGVLPGFLEDQDQPCKETSRLPACTTSYKIHVRSHMPILPSARQSTMVRQW
jgi:hypothetical protein